MKTKLYIYTLFTAIQLCCTSISHAQKHWCDSINVTAMLSTSVSSNKELNPLFLYSLEWGKYTQYKQFETLFLAKLDGRIANFKHFTLNAGMSGIATSEKDRCMIHEAYFGGNLFMFDYIAGLSANNTLAKNDKMTAGHYLMSSNARPIPRVGIGIFDYWNIPVPYIKDWIQIRGGVYVGRTFNENFDNEYTDAFTHDVILSEKYAYARISKWHLKPYYGLTHSVMMGGTMADGTKIPIDFIASFLAKGSDKFTGQFRGESSNAAGGHQGVWDMGIDFDFNNLEGTVYCKRPFSVYAGKHFFSPRSKDFYLGSIVKIKNSQILKAISVEWMKTDYQGGEGTPDPIGVDKNGNTIVVFPGDVPYDTDGLKNWLYEHFEAETIENWNKTHHDCAYKNIGVAYRFFQDIWNHGWIYGGRVNYLGNSFYPQGWSVNGLSTSSAYFHSQKTAEIYGKGYHWQREEFFSNNRIHAVTIAADLSVNHQVSAFAKIGITKNHGNLCEKYEGGPYSWQHAQNYYFDTSKMEYYTMVDLNYRYNNTTSLRTIISYDWGELYNALGIRLSISYKLSYKDRKWSTTT